jgi:hypothetical protein
MKKWVLALVLVAVALAPLRADLTMVQTMTMEGPAAAAMGGQMPTITLRIKGSKARSDVQTPTMNIVAITDLATKEVTILNPGTKTAQVISSESATGKVATPQVDVSYKPTGKTQTIDGQACDEHQFAITLNMAEMTGDQVPPEAAAMMKDVKMVMNGSVWTAKAAPGAAEYAAYTQAALKSGIFAAMAGMPAGRSGGMDKLMAAAASAPGVPYLTEIAMTVEGTGPMVDVMKNMGPMKMVQKLTSVSTEPLTDDLFRVPEGYTVEKK